MTRFRKLLVVFDSIERDRRSLQLAFRLAQDAGGQVSLVHAIPPLPQELLEGMAGLNELKETLHEAAEASLRDALEEFPAYLQPDTPVQVDTRVQWGDVDMEVSRLVLREGYDLVLKATGRRQALPGQFIGSMDMRLLRKCPSPVWLVKPGADPCIETILAAVDPGDERGEHRGLNASILEMGVFLSRMEGADLHVLFAWTPWGETLLRHRMRTEAYDEYASKMRSRAGRLMTELLQPHDDDIPPAHRHFMEGNPEDAIPEFVTRHNVDVVVMGTVGRTGVPGFFIGNTAERILRGVESSVLAVKPGGFESPVGQDGSD